MSESFLVFSSLFSGVFISARRFFLAPHIFCCCSFEVLTIIFHFHFHRFRLLDCVVGFPTSVSIRILFLWVRRFEYLIIMHKAELGLNKYTSTWMERRKKNWFIMTASDVEIWNVIRLIAAYIYIVWFTHNFIAISQNIAGSSSSSHTLFFIFFVSYSFHFNGPRTSVCYVNRHHNSHLSS